MSDSRLLTYRVPAESHASLHELADRADVSMATIVRNGVEYALEADVWPDEHGEWDVEDRNFSVWVPPDLDQRLDEAATEADLSQSEALRWATHLALDLHDTPPAESAETRLSEDPV